MTWLLGMAVAQWIAATGPGWEQLRDLGLPALGLIVGAGAYHWFVGKPALERALVELTAERARYREEMTSERASCRETLGLERQRADRERADRQESEARERKSYEVTLPALQEASRAMDTIMKWLDRQGRQ